jgi:exodeoxyribonuclease V alpha subunit
VCRGSRPQGQRDLITVLGHAPMILAGEFVRAIGTRVNDRTYGVQFRASFLKGTAPRTVEGIETYLGSPMIRGIGAVYATKLVQKVSEGSRHQTDTEPWVSLQIRREKLKPSVSALSPSAIQPGKGP